MLFSSLSFVAPLIVLHLTLVVGGLVLTDAPTGEYADSEHVPGQSGPDNFWYKRDDLDPYGRDEGVLILAHSHGATPELFAAEKKRIADLRESQPAPPDFHGVVGFAYRKGVDSGLLKSSGGSTTESFAAEKERIEKLRGNNKEQYKQPSHQAQGREETKPKTFKFEPLGLPQINRGSNNRRVIRAAPGVKSKHDDPRQDKVPKSRDQQQNRRKPQQRHQQPSTKQSITHPRPSQRTTRHQSNSQHHSQRL